MIQKHSNDPDVAHAAQVAVALITDTLHALPRATTYDYGGHLLHVGEYDVCERCTAPIAEAQAAEQAIRELAGTVDDETVKEHVELAADLFHAESEAAILRAELHNGHGTEPILNALLAYQYERRINDDYHHTHTGGAA
jgi:hypothetical protein